MATQINYVPPSLGVDLDRAITDLTDMETPFATLGARVQDDVGNEYQFVQAQGAIAANDIVTVDGSYDVSPLTGVGAGIAYAVAPFAIADNAYGWVQTRGVVTANVASGTADNAQLAKVTDANGDLVTVAAATGTTVAKALAAESGGLASVYFGV